MSNPKHVLDVRIGPGKYRRYEFDSEEDMREWEQIHRKSRLYIPYFLVGVGINLILHFAGLNLGKNIVMGSLVGMGVPFASMYLFSELHFRIARKISRKR